MEESIEEYNVTDLQLQYQIKWEECLNEGENDTVPEGWCTRSHDKLLCWPPSPPGTDVLQSCFPELHGVQYDITQNASRVCSDEGIWANYTNYSLCRELVIEQPDQDDRGYHIEVTATVYLVGFTISLIALCLAVTIFLFYKDLRCLRNTIHTNLFCSHILVAAFWILNYSLQMKADMASCTAIIILLHYFQLTNFFWMFVEGLYLYMLVVETFVRENMKLMGYMFIGWGLPGVVILIWSIAQIFIRDQQSEGTESFRSVDETSIDVLSLDESTIINKPMNFDTSGLDDSMDSNCSWYNWSSTSQWIFQTPALIILAINFIFLIRIMIVLITKLRSSTNVETQMNRKATKALLVLIPLLGVTYVLLIWGPDQSESDSTGSAHTHYVYYNIIRNALLSTQGFTVALLYCFLNTEVRNAVRHHFQRWEDSRQIGRRLYKKCDYGNGSGRMNRSRKKRESTTSDITTMTTVHSSRVSNGSVSGRHQPDI